MITFNNHDQIHKSFFFKAKVVQLNMVAHAHNSSTMETEAAGLKPAWAIQQDPVTKKQNSNKDKIISSTHYKNEGALRIGDVSIRS